MQICVQQAYYSNIDMYAHMFTTGKFTSPNDQSVCWAHEGVMPDGYIPVGPTIA